MQALISPIHPNSISAFMASTSSSHQQKAFSGIEPPNKRRKVEESSRVFDVFINHRGPDVKLTLATQLYNSLKELHIKAFLDLEEKELGDSFPSTIETAIRSASVHIAIFSKGYAESAWCLDELVLMLQSKAKIIPVFYKVEPWELRRIEKGVYAEAFLKYEEKGRYLDKIEEWKEALQQISYTAGYEFKNSDSSDCKDIVSAVQKEVQKKELLYVAKYPVGLHEVVEDFKRKCFDKLVEDFESQCGMKKTAKEKANVVGIFGMGGVGKTTLSKELFNKKRSEYTRASFLFDVREACASGRLPSLQSKILKDIFCEDHSFLSSEEGTSCLMDRWERISSLSFLIVLDDIDKVEQLDAIFSMDILNKSGHNLVIITTRDVGVLVNAGIDIAYNLKGLNREYGRELFCWHAFNQPLPRSGYEDLVQDFVNMCGGLPLSMIVLGRHVFGRDQWYWQDELEKLKETLPRDIKRKLMISIDGLDKVEKHIFMDIACFFIEKSVTKAMNIWKGSGWRARHALETLKEKCLVERVHVCNPESKWESSAVIALFRMHDHLRDLGREMADELSHPRRVWRPQVLKSLESEEFRNILAQTKGRCFHSFLYKSMGCEIEYFLGEPEESSDSSLLWLRLEYVSHLPLDLNSDINSSSLSWIPLQNLQCLRISNGRFQKLWQSDVQAPSHLKELQILDTFLDEFPDFSGKLNNIEKLVLDAKYIQTDIWSSLESSRMNLRRLMITGSNLTGNLASNDIAEGSKFKSLVIKDFRGSWKGEIALNNEGTALSDVEDLEIKGCRLVTKILINGNCCKRLQSLRLSEMENLTEVDLERIKTLNCLEISKCMELEELRLAHLSCLEKITIENCKHLKRVSENSNLAKLVELKISGCVELEELGLAHLSCLKKITIEKCNHLKRVSEISNFGKLVELKVSGCVELEELGFAHLNCLEKITIKNCYHLKRVSEISNLPKLVELNISGCVELEELGLAHLRCLEKITIENCNHLKRVSEIFNFAKLVELKISGCAELEELGLAHLSCMETITIENCDHLKRVSEISNLAKLVELKISGCAELEELGLAHLNCLKTITIENCNHLKKVSEISNLAKLVELKISGCAELEELTLAHLSCLEKFTIENCNHLKRVSEISNLSKLVELKISDCVELEELGLAHLSSLERITIESCNPLKRLSEISNLAKLVELKISRCDLLEELGLAHLSCLKEISIGSCEKLQKIMLPTTAYNLVVECCKDLQRVAGAGDLTKLQFLSIYECPALEELPSFARVSNMDSIGIWSCGKLQNVVVPTTLNRLNVGGCSDLQRVAGDLTMLKELFIIDCPALQEFPNLAGAGSLQNIAIDSCERLQNVAGIEESCELNCMRLTYCGDAVIPNYIHKLKSVPSERMVMIGRAVNGAESSLNKNLFCDTNIGVDAVIDISTENYVSQLVLDWSYVIGCFVVVVDSSTSLEDILEVREGEWIITAVHCDEYIDKFVDALRGKG